MKTKKCTQCQEDKPLNLFYYENYRNKYRANCKACMLKYRKNKYKTDPKFRQRLLDHTSVYQKKVRTEYTTKVLKILKERGCIDCGNHDPIILEFDHVRGTKTKSISRMTSEKFKWDIIELEIKKCEVRCANCHRRKTAKERNYYSDIDLDSL